MVFGTVLRLYVLHAANLGVLGGGHSLYVASKCGVTLSWLYKYAVIKGDSRVMKYYAVRFNGRPTFRVAEIEKLLDTLRSHFFHRYGIHLDDATLENILCSEFPHVTISFPRYSSNKACTLFVHCRNVPKG